VIGMAATWDSDLVHRMGQTISTEARAKYNEAMRQNDREMFFGLTFWAPNINIFRDPRWGRGQETYGEDPFLTSRMAVAFVTGMQGDDPTYLKVVSTPKHFAVHSGPEPSRHRDNVDVSPHDLEDTYLPAFRAAVTEAHAQSVMCAYNAIDVAPACANTMLLRDHLRTDWHFDGYVVSDCGAVADVATNHHYAVDMAHAAADAVKAGTDLECGFGQSQGFAALTDAIHQNLHHRSGSRHGVASPFSRALSPRHVRPAVQLCIRPHPLQRGQLRGTSPAFAAGCAGIDGAAQEREWRAAAEA
jgi:beta-glucosidase